MEGANNRLNVTNWELKERIEKVSEPAAPWKASQPWCAALASRVKANDDLMLKRTEAGVGLQCYDSRIFRTMILGMRISGK